MLLYIASSKLAGAKRWDPIPERQGTNQRARREKVLATEPDGLGSVPETHMGGEESQLPKAVTSTHRLWREHAHVHANQINVIDKIFLKRRREDERITNALQ